MRRWLLLLLMIVMSTQFVWAAAAPYCGHESNLAAKKHFGHHEHKHQADQEAPKVADPPVEKGTLFHVDCESCHLGASATLPAEPTSIELLPAMRVVVAPQLQFLSHTPAGPERPDRALDAAAVRFGGGVGSDPQLI
jgi:hypothetical protein